MSREGIQLLAADLQVNEGRYLDCEFCGRANKMSVTRTSEGLLYNCFSSACDAKGFIADFPDYDRKLRTLPPRHRRWVGKPQSVVREDWEYFNKRFGIGINVTGYEQLDTDWNIYVTHHDEYLFPIRDRQDVRVGEVVRQPRWSGLNQPPRAGRAGAPKALTYLEDGNPRLSWHRPWTGGVDVKPAMVLVEDQVSAEKIAQVTQHTGVALLGNTLGMAELTQLAAEEADMVYIWLDADMASQAYTLNAEYGSNFKNCRVVFTELDPKDLSESDLLAQFAD